MTSKNLQVRKKTRKDYGQNAVNIVYNDVEGTSGLSLYTNTQSVILVWF